MLMKTLAVWLLERAAELLTGAILAYLVFGPSNFPPGSGLAGEIRVGLVAVSFFYVASGYIISCVAFGLLTPRRKPLLHGATMAALFLAHSLVFSLFIAGGAFFPVLLIIGGAIAVFAFNAAGTALLQPAAHGGGSS